MSYHKVSIIIPVYNVENYLKECLQSVLCQTHKNIEIICVDDGSSDGSLKILEEYQNIDRRILVFSYGINKGVSYARNFGLEKASGKYVYFLDADDYLFENAVKDLATLADKNSTDCIYFNSKLQMETEGIGSPRLEFNLKQFNKVVLTGEKLFSVLMNNQAYTGSVCRQFWKKSFLIENQLYFPNGYLAEDALFSFKAMLLGKRMMIVDKSYHVYRRHGGTMSTNVSSQKAIALFSIYCQMMEIWIKGNFDTEVSKAIELRCSQIFKMSRQLYLRNKRMITTDNFKNDLEKHLFRLLLEQKQNKSVIITQSIVEKLRKYEQVIVYGAGGYAVEVIEALEHCGISVAYIAVTTVHRNTTSINNIPIYEVDAITEMGSNSIVVMGVLKKNRDDVISTLREKGFFNYIELD